MKAAERQGLLWVIGVVLCREFEVCQLYPNIVVVRVVSVLLAEDVFGFDIAVHDIL